jgi:quercetin dioxygenase-like cupin family protein
MTKIGMESEPSVAHRPYALRRGEGDRKWVLSEIATIKATPAQTGGLFALKESYDRRGEGPPMHVHAREDEGCYVLEGEITFFVDDEVVQASAGAWIYLPRGVPHSLRVESDDARTLWFVAPGAFMSFFSETFPRATDASSSPPRPPDFDRITAALAEFGVQIVGPAPGTT